MLLQPYLDNNDVRTNKYLWYWSVSFLVERANQSIDIKLWLRWIEITCLCVIYEGNDS